MQSSLTCVVAEPLSITRIHKLCLYFLLKLLALIGYGSFSEGLFSEQISPLALRSVLLIKNTYLRISRDGSGSSCYIPNVECIADMDFTLWTARFLPVNSLYSMHTWH